MKRSLVISSTLAWIIGASYLSSPFPPWCDTRESELFSPPQADFSPRFLVHATAYCSCPICCGKWSGGPTASGVMPREGVTIAADKRVLPFNTCLELPGLGRRLVQDTGSAIKMFRIDVFFSDHTNAVVFGFKRDLLVGFCDEELS